MKTVLIKGAPVLSEVPVSSEEGALPLYADLLAVRAGRIAKYGAFKGSLLALWRILRCNPFSHGGYDPVP